MMAGDGEEDQEGAELEKEFFRLLWDALGIGVVSLDEKRSTPQSLEEEPLSER